MLSACSRWYPEPRGASLSHHQSSAERARASARLEPRARRRTRPEDTGAIAPVPPQKRKVGVWAWRKRRGRGLGPSTTFCFRGRDFRCESSGFEGVFIQSRSSGLAVSRIKRRVLGGQLLPHAPDAQRSVVEPWVKPASHAPRRPAPAAVEFAVVLIRFSSAETSFYSSTRDFSFAGRPAGSHALGQLLALPLASLALWGPGACSLVRAAPDLSAASLQLEEVWLLE